MRVPPCTCSGDGSATSPYAPAGSGSRKCTCRMLTPPMISNSTKSMPLSTVCCSSRRAARRSRQLGPSVGEDLGGGGRAHGVALRRATATRESSSRSSPVLRLVNTTVTVSLLSSGDDLHALHRDHVVEPARERALHQELGRRGERVGVRHEDELSDAAAEVRAVDALARIREQHLVDQVADVIVLVRSRRCGRGRRCGTGSRSSRSCHDQRPRSTVDLSAGCWCVPTPLPVLRHRSRAATPGLSCRCSSTPRAMASASLRRPHRVLVRAGRAQLRRQRVARWRAPCCRRRRARHGVRIRLAA